MMYDKDQGGSIDMDECMEIFFRRFGKLNLEVCIYGANTPTPQIPHCEQLLRSSHARDTFHIENPIELSYGAVSLH